MTRFLPAVALMISMSLSSVNAYAVPDIKNVSDQTVNSMNKTSQLLFKKHKVDSDEMIACYRKAMRGDKQASVHTFIVAVAHAFSMDYQEAVKIALANGMSTSEATDRIDTAIVQSEQAMRNYKYLVQSDQSFKYCQSVLESDPEEAKAIKEIITQMRKNE